MAGSSNGKGIIVEPTGEQSSFWASNFEHTLRIMREELHSNANIGLRILKFPEHLRHPTAEYTPMEWRFGLHNRDENQTVISKSEAAKQAVVVLFGLDEQSKWISFCDVVVPDPKAMLKCYGLHKEVNGLLEDEIKQVLALDALFLSVWPELSSELIIWDSTNFKLITYKLSNWGMWNYFSNTFHVCYSMVPLDMCKIENQIPFDLIKNANKYVQDLANSPQVNGDHTNSIGAKDVKQVPDSYLEIWMKVAVKYGMSTFMDISDGFYEGANVNQIVEESHHILDAAYKVICGVDGMKRTSDDSQEDYIPIPTATRLKESGIRIEGVVRPLCAMSYDREKKCLSLPKMKICDDTVSLVRNISRYEEYSLELDNCMFHDYIILMLDLIQTPLDLNHLTKCGVVYNGCGNRGVDVWQALDQGISLVSSSSKHNRMKVDINNRCKLRHYRFWSEFKRLFLSRPWLTLSIIAVTLVTVATLIQTYVAIISSNHMKP